MSAIYLVRHGQAGTRDNYDSLSDLGCRQARLLGEYLKSQGVRFSAAYAGKMRRQISTAEEALAGLGADATPLTIDERWNEFDLEAVYAAIAPRLAAEDPVFRNEFEEMTREAADPLSAVHRTWRRCDTMVVQAWIEDQYSIDGESWAQFGQRIIGCQSMLATHAPGDAIAIFTSATPIAILTAHVVGSKDTMRLAGVMYNTAITTLRERDGEFALFSFNGVPHLSDPSMRTFR